MSTTTRIGSSTVVLGDPSPEVVRHLDQCLRDGAATAGGPEDVIIIPGSPEPKKLADVLAAWAGGLTDAAQAALSRHDHEALRDAIVAFVGDGQ